MIDHIAFHQKKLNEIQRKLDRVDVQQSELKNSLVQKEAPSENAISYEWQTKLEAFEKQLSAMQELLSKVNKRTVNPYLYDRIGSKWIYVERKNRRNWEEAEAFCREINCHLIRIQNDSELRALGEKLERHTPYWLGNNDVAKESKFVSVASGQPAAFLKEDSQPENWIEKQSCVHIYNGEMYNTHCRSLAVFICEPNFG
ncbi:C-type lectin 37Db-like [Drosophila ficusphila]|uniref:C-type lectin 37Db-like n=1 Tax=Drosophila ficusphila TaxID=30025 RepID=UPI0007E7D577|nr:C-type lectin 37Db-like [Drosophila ficusphila]